MSMHRYDFPSSGFPFYLGRPGDIWRWMFADVIRGLRLARRLSIEKAARLAGMEFSEWEALESGSPRRFRAAAPRGRRSRSRLGGAVPSAPLVLNSRPEPEPPLGALAPLLIAV